MKEIPGPEACHRAANLVRSLLAGDMEHYVAVLTSDEHPHETLLAMSGLVAVLQGSVSNLSGDDPDTVLQRHTTALAKTA